MHGLDRRDAGDRILGEVPAVGERAGEASFDVDGRARHAGDDAGVDEARVVGLHEDDVLLGQEVVQHADDADVEALGLEALEDGEAVALHAGADLGRSG